MTLINQIKAASGPDDLVRAFAYVLEAICIESNVDWQKVSDDPRAAIERVHSLAVDAYYSIPAEYTLPALKARGDA